MKAMIFAAGLGTRLKPLTDRMPKALVPVAGKPLLEHVILKLRAAGFNEIVVNVHHFADQIIGFLEAKHRFGIRIEVSDERGQLLDTGGGVRRAAPFFDDGAPFLVHNVDILSDLDLGALYRHHLRRDPLATLVVSQRHTSRYLLFTPEGRLRGWLNERTGETKPPALSPTPDLHKLAFAGIHVMSPRVFALMDEWPEVFPIMDFYLAQAATQRIEGYVPPAFHMLDVGKLDTLHEAETFVATYPPQA